MSIDVSPNWYFNIMHVSAIVTTPVNILGIFIILCCQTRQLASFRWHLLMFQVCSMITDFAINIGTLPVIFSPFPIGRPYGCFTAIFQFFGLETSTKLQCILVFISIFLTAGSVELLFFFRYQAILPFSHPLKISTFSTVFLLTVWQTFLSSIMIIIFNMAIPDQKAAKTQFAQLYPELQYLVADEYVIIFYAVVEPIHVIFMFSCFFRACIGLIIVILLIWMSSIALQSVQLSTSTKKLQLQLIRSLSYQTAVPILAFYVPVFVIVVPVMFNIQNSQFSYFLSIICSSLHTFSGTLSMLYFNRHYRQWVACIIKNRTIILSVPISKINNPRAKIKVSALGQLSIR